MVSIPSFSCCRQHTTGASGQRNSWGSAVSGCSLWMVDSWMRNIRIAPGLAGRGNKHAAAKNGLGTSATCGGHVRQSDFCELRQSNARLRLWKETVKHPTLHFSKWGVKQDRDRKSII